MFYSPTKRNFIWSSPQQFVPNIIWDMSVDKACVAAAIDVIFIITQFANWDVPSKICDNVQVEIKMNFRFVNQSNTVCFNTAQRLVAKTSVFRENTVHNSWEISVGSGEVWWLWMLLLYIHNMNVLELSTKLGGSSSLLEWQSLKRCRQKMNCWMR